MIRCSGFPVQYWILVQSRLILSCDTCLESNTVLQRVGKSERFFLGSEWLVIIPPKKKLFIFHTIATRPKPVQSKAVYCTVQCVVTSQKSVSRLQSSPEWSRFYGNGRRRWDLRCRYYWQLVLHQLLATKKHVSNQRELANEPIVGRSRSRGAEGAAAGKALLESCTSSSEKWSSGGVRKTRSIVACLEADVGNCTQCEVKNVYEGTFQVDTLGNQSTEVLYTM